jgi:hypothetical protein
MTFGIDDRREAMGVLTVAEPTNYKGGLMHAVVVNVSVTNEEPALKELREQVVPAVSQAPGFVTGYWTRKGNTGLSMAIFESEDAANSSSERVRDAAPEGVTIESVEVREVVANA